MARITIVLGSSNFQVSSEVLQNESTLLVAEPRLAIYRVQTQTSPQLLQEFLRALQEGSQLPINHENMDEFHALSIEFGARRLQDACELYRHQLIPAYLRMTEEAAAEAGPHFVQVDQAMPTWTWCVFGVGLLIAGVGMAWALNPDLPADVVDWVKAVFGGLWRKAKGQ
jgi:hypothetical protein